MPKKRRMETIVLILLQGRPLVIMDEEYEDPKKFESIEAAREWATNATGIGIVNAENIMICDVGTGESDFL